MSKDVEKQPVFVKHKKVIIITITAIVLILVVSFINHSISVKKHKDIAQADNTPKERTIYVYDNQNEIYATFDKNDNDKLLTSYKCNNKECTAPAFNREDKEILIYDDKYFTLNYTNNVDTDIHLPNEKYQSIKYYNDYLAIKNNDKYALYNLKTNSFTTEFIYDGVSTREEENAIISLYKNDSKYNQLLDAFDDSTIVKSYNHCYKLSNGTNEGYCNNHIDGDLTSKDVDDVIDKVLSQYPDLNDIRIYTIKTAVEATGLPYFWGGGHGTLSSTIYTAEKTWNKQYCTVWGDGFKNQKGGQAYPCGLDCSGFARWVYYTATSIDIMGKGVSVIGGRFHHPDYTQIPEEQALPGDLIMDKDHVTVYLYRDDEGKPISVHAAFDHLKVEISNYKRGNEFYRLNIWQ